MVTDAVKELVGFVAAFLSTGALGFRFAMRSRHDDEIVWRAARRAALLGLIGSAVTLAMIAFSAKKPFNQLTEFQLGGWIVAIVAFAFAAADKRALWPFAATGVIAGGLAPLFFGQITRSINPVHRFAAGLWIGTLFVLVIAGLNTVLRATADKIERGKIAADLINTFSPLALGSFALLAASGVWTAWRHLKRLDALWTTPYGYALIAKLCVVVIVVALGAFNWRRQRPLLGTDSAAVVLRRSATWELAAAGIVLVITAVLVSLPSPR